MDLLGSVFSNKFLILFSTAFVIIAGVVSVQFYNYSDEVLLELTEQEANTQIELLRSFRSLYTKHVVKKLRGSDFKVSHQFEDKLDTVPLPATMTKLIIDSMGKNDSGSSAYLYSAYPFPWRIDKGGLNDSFRKEAWISFAKKSKATFSRIEVLNGTKVLRFARPDVMRKDCIRCHNSHPDSPKINWKEGDVRGVLEVQVPIITSNSNNILKSKHFFIGIVSLVLLGLLTIIFSVINFMDKLKILQEKTLRQKDKTKRKLEILENSIEVKTRDLYNKSEDLIKSNTALEDQAKVLIRQEEQLIITNKELEKRSEEIERTSRFKSDFLANMSHEIRTPMNGVIGVLELLKDSDLSTIQRELLETMNASGNNLLTIVNDILDVSKIESGQMVFEDESFHLKRLIKNCIFLFKSDADKKDIFLKYNIKNTEIEQFKGDQVRIRQILSNLISNAIKFTKEGGVEIHVEIKHKEGQKYDVHFSVKDTGVGIAKANQEKVFQAFTQADVSTTRMYGGTGLGLTISSKLCHLMKGKIWLDSVEGEGSTFNFTLPLTESIVSGEIEDDKSLHNTEKLGEKFPLRILVAEDNLINQKIIRMLLEKVGYKCDMAEDGQHAINALDNKKYDVVFMDMQMPRMGGLEATQKVLTSWGEESPLIVAMTANVLDEDKMKCFNVGMIDFIEKPVTLKSLISTLSNCHKIIGERG